MELKIPSKGSQRFLVMLNLFDAFTPYSKLNNREKQVLSELLYQDYELRALDEDKRNRLIFDYDTRRELAKALKITTNSVYNIMSSLKRKGFIGKSSLDRRLKYTDTIKIKFLDD
jgi:DNA-binding MarR family transcriptional regulator